MITKVLMERKIGSDIIRQESKLGYYCGSDLLKIGNKYRINNNLGVFDLSQWLSTKSTSDFISELKKQNPNEEILITGRGRGAITWMHPFLFLDMALAMHPKLKIEVYSWIFDGLIKYRNESGDSYKRMTGALWESTSNKTEFPKIISRLAITIKKEVGVENWESASEDQLKLRDSIHDAIATLSDVVKDYDACVELSIKKARHKFGNRS